jgi:hypothetical protein
MNGQAERMIQQVKKVLKSTLEGKSCSFNELTTILFEAVIIVNSRPIGIAGRESDLEAGTPITPLHLMLGRATIEAPQMDFNTDFNLTRRLQFVDEVKKNFGISGVPLYFKAWIGPTSGGRARETAKWEMWFC